MARLVIDVSACMPWCCEDEATSASEELLQRAANRHTLHVPSVWPWEIMNALAVATRRRRIEPDRAARFLQLLAIFDIRISGAPGIEDMPRLSILASLHRLTAYDVAYLDLAKRLAIPLATLDNDLKEAAVSEGVTVL